MTENILTEEYLKRFPTVFRSALEENQKYQKAFFSQIETEYEDLKVFRIVHREDKLDDDDFICNVEEARVYGNPMKYKPRLAHYAVSVNEDLQQLVKAMTFPNPRHPWMGVAEGWMKKEYGPADFVEDNTHHNWYLFEKSIPIQKKEFKIVSPEKYKPYLNGNKEY